MGPWYDTALGQIADRLREAELRRLERDLPRGDVLPALASCAIVLIAVAAVLA